MNLPCRNRMTTHPSKTENEKAKRKRNFYKQPFFTQINLKLILWNYVWNIIESILQKIIQNIQVFKI